MASDGTTKRGWKRAPGELSLALLVMLSALLAGCERRAVNFSQYPGFREWYRANPPSEMAASAEDRALLERYRPRLFLPADAEGPISFYEDYVAQGVLYDRKDMPISRQVTPTILNAHKADPGVVFVHRPTGAPVRPVAYARIDREILPGGAETPGTPLTFLTYHFVFRTSGLPAGLAPWQRFLVELIADPSDWHQLDHYTAVTIVLIPAGSRLEPVAAIVQQHNYLRTYLLGAVAEPDRLVLPRDRRLAVDAAIWSNELYPHQAGRQVRRAVGHLTPDTARYLATGQDRPFISADDITEPQRETEYRLEYLPQSDAFYVFQGWLGARRSMPGRDGPPGADYNTLPRFKPRATQLALFRWRDGDDEFATRLRRAGDPATAAITLATETDRLRRDLACARPIVVACGP